MVVVVVVSVLVTRVAIFEAVLTVLVCRSSRMSSSSFGGNADSGSNIVTAPTIVVEIELTRLIIVCNGSAN